MEFDVQLISWWNWLLLEGTMKEAALCLSVFLTFVMFTGSSFADDSDTPIKESDIYQCPHCGTEYNIDNATCIGDYCYVTGENNTIIELYHPEPCVIEGYLKVKKNWFGYLTWIVFDRTKGKFLYEFSYPEERCCVNILLYLEEQVDLLRAHMYCEQRQDFVNEGSNQVIELTSDAPWSGCKNESDLIQCSGGRMLRADKNRKWFIAAANCDSPNGLDVKYKLYIYGYHGACPAIPDSGTSKITALNAILIYLLFVIICSAVKER